MTEPLDSDSSDEGRGGQAPAPAVLQGTLFGVPEVAHDGRRRPSGPRQVTIWGHAEVAKTLRAREPDSRQDSRPGPHHRPPVGDTPDPPPREAVPSA